MIGLCVASLLPTGGGGAYCNGNLRVMESRFGSGYIVGGTHPSIRRGGITPTEETRALSNLASNLPGYEVRANYAKLGKLPTYFEAEDLAVAHRRSAL